MIKKIKYVLLLVFIILLTSYTKSQAKITANNPSVSSGGTVNITINSQEKVASGAIKVESNGGLTLVSASGGQVNGGLVAFAGTSNITSGIAKYTFKAPKVTKTQTFKVVFVSQDMADADGKAISSSTVTSTVTVKASSDSESSGSTTTTKPTFTSKNETVYATGSVNVRSSYSTSSASLGKLKEGESVKRTGLATKAIDGITWSKVTYNGKTAYVSSAYLTTKKPSATADVGSTGETDNANLKSLEVTPTGLAPVFSSGVTEYTMTVGLETSKIEIVAEPESSKSKVSITGNENLKVGTNTIVITVTAEDKTKKEYNIVVTKEDKKQLKLSELLVEGLPLEPEFDSDVHEYTLTLDRGDVTELNVTATPSNSNVEVEIVGNTQLQAGKNTITILLKSSDTEESATYQITVDVPQMVPVEEEKPNKELFVYTAMGVLAVIILIFIISIIRDHRKEKEDDFTAIYEEPNDKKHEKDAEEDIEQFNMEELPKLENEDLPNSLRKDSTKIDEEIEEINEEETENIVKDDVKYEEDLETQRTHSRMKQLDDLYSVENDDLSNRRKGKHF